jgi:antitoxin VapB
MGLNIKNPRTVGLIDELTGLTGENKTEAITVAVEERLRRLREQEGHGRLKAMMEIADKMAPLFRPPYDTIDHGELLYDDETGLPK